MEAMAISSPQHAFDAQARRDAEREAVAARVQAADVNLSMGTAREGIRRAIASANGNYANGVECTISVPMQAQARNLNSVYAKTVLPLVVAELAQSGWDARVHIEPRQQDERGFWQGGCWMVTIKPIEPIVPKPIVPKKPSVPKPSVPKPSVPIEPSVREEFAKPIGSVATPIPVAMLDDGPAWMNDLDKPKP